MVGVPADAGFFAPRSAGTAAGGGSLSRVLSRVRPADPPTAPWDVPRLGGGLTAGAGVGARGRPRRGRPGRAVRLEFAPLRGFLAVVEALRDHGLPSRALPG